MSTIGSLRRELFRVIWQGLLMSVVLLAATGGSVYGWYLTTWENTPYWEEAVRDWYRPKMMIERWIRFRWIHPDSLYWVSRVRLDQGPLVLEGLPNDALYWSFTYYEGTEVNESVSSSDVVLEPDGSYRIVLSTEPPVQEGPVGPDGPANWIKVREGAKRGVLYLRIYEPRHVYPSRVPRVSRGGEILVERADL